MGGDGTADDLAVHLRDCVALKADAPQWDALQRSTRSLAEITKFSRSCGVSGGLPRKARTLRCISPSRPLTSNTRFGDPMTAPGKASRHSNNTRHDRRTKMAFDS